MAYPPRVPACVFCAILAGKSPASVVYRDRLACAFMDIAPLTPGHTLVVPLAHAVGLRDLDPAAGARVFRIGQRIANALRRSELHVEGITLFLADGREAGQEVMHLHLHVLPRFAGDGVHIDLGPQHRGSPTRAALDAAAAQLRARL